VQIELSRLLEQAAAGRPPETDATVAQLVDRHAEVADWDLSTRKANEYYIQRVIKPALGHLQVRKIRGPTLEAVHAPSLLWVRVSDDGCGGARVEARGGLAGLAERIGTVDGRLQLSSPPGVPTVVTVELLSHA
jgi:hypothetical protein